MSLNKYPGMSLNKYLYSHHNNPHNFPYNYYRSQNKFHSKMKYMSLDNH